MSDPTPEVAINADMGAEPSAPFLGPLSASHIASSTAYPAPFRVLTPSETSIPALLEDLLKNGGLSVKQMARLLNVNDEAVRQYVRGRRTNPSLSWMMKFADFCGFEFVLRRKKVR